MAAQVLSAVTGASAGTIPIRRALVSVFDKSGVVDFVGALADRGVSVVSTGGTATQLREAGIQVDDVSALTGGSEIMNGRVKSLHPAVHGSLLAVRGNMQHEDDLRSITPAAFHDPIGIDCVIGNLYPFQAAAAQHADCPGTVIENIDVGGPTMLRSAAKNHAYVLPVCSPALYSAVLAEVGAGEEGVAATDLAFRRHMAAATFATLAEYDGQVAHWMSQYAEGGLGGEAVAPVTSRVYVRAAGLKYGNNPHQKPAAVAAQAGLAPKDSDATTPIPAALQAQLPFQVVNGAPGYINLLDALNAWQLVQELSRATEAVVGERLPAAASFKHVSPAGAAVGLPLPADLLEVYGVTAKQQEHMTPLAAAYIRARQCDPLCSFGDFVAVSHVVDAATATVLKGEVSDGIIAPGFTQEATAILSGKKGGGYIMLAMDDAYDPPAEEWREVFGVPLVQQRNTRPVTAAAVSDTVACGTPPSKEALLDLLVSNITVKYTQSNSVGFALGGQMVGVGAGQQSRVDCVKLAGRKVATWWLRQHPKVRSLPFKAGVKRQEKVNARVRYIEGDMTPVEQVAWEAQFSSPPPPLTREDVEEWMGQLTGVSLASDAFFPFRDGIDTAARYGVSTIVQPGGSVGDEGVIQAAKEHAMTMTFSGTRLFHH